jgi:hypothetical protein
MIFNKFPIVAQRLKHKTLDPEPWAKFLFIFYTSKVSFYININIYFKIIKVSFYINIYTLELVLVASFYTNIDPKPK